MGMSEQMIINVLILINILILVFRVRRLEKRIKLKEEREAIEFAREFMSDAVHETATQFRRQEGR